MSRSFSSLTTSPADCQHSSGSLATQVLTTRSSAGGDIGCTCEIGCGSSRKIAEMRDACVAPENASRVAGPDATSQGFSSSGFLVFSTDLSFPDRGVGFEACAGRVSVWRGGC